LSQRAEALLARARDADADPQEAQALRMEAITVAILAATEQINDLRDSVVQVSNVLDGPGAFDTGSGLYYISESLEKIADK
jgi:hypothetical protein